MSVHPELALISAVLRTKDVFTAIEKGVTDQVMLDFTDEWRWITSYAASHGRCPDKLTFRTKWPGVTIKNVDDVGHWSEEVIAAWVVDRTSTAMEHTLDELTAGRNPSVVVDELQRQLVTIRAVTDRACDHEVIATVNGALTEVTQRAERRRERGLPGVPTGWPTLDTALGGWLPGCIYVVGARPGVGKSWLLVKSAAQAVMAGHTVQYNALEQSSNQIAFRAHHLLAEMTGQNLVEAHDLMTGRADPEGYRLLLDHLSSEVPGRLWVNDTTRGRVSPMSIAAQIERNQPDVVFVDYLQLMDLTRDWQALGAVVGELKLIAERYQVPIVAASQLNRALGTSREPPGSEAFSGSDSIGQDADGLVTLTKWSRRTLKLRLAKHRHGPDGHRWWAAFELTKGRIAEITADEAQRLVDADRDDDDEVEVS